MGMFPATLNPFGITCRIDAVVKWIQTDGMQWIDTLTPVTTTTRVEASWRQMGTAIQQRLFGVNDGSGKTFALYINNYSAWAVNTGTSSGGQMQAVRANTDYTGTFNLATGVCEINGTSRSNGGTPFNSTNTIPIFTRRNSGTIMTDYPAQIRLYSFRIYDGDRLVRDFVPVRIGQVGCLYDRVGRGIFRIGGTGAFKVGPDASLPYDSLVDYVESNGTQYVNTGVVYASYKSLVVSVDVAYTYVNQNGIALFGASTITPRLWIGLQNAGVGFISGMGSGTTNIAFPDGFDVTSRFSLSSRYVSGRRLFVVNGTTLDSSQVQPAPSTPIFLFGSCRGPGQESVLSYGSKARVYGCTISQGGTMVHDYVPVRVGSAGALYDRANPTGGPLGNGLYLSATTTALTPGNDI